jgi:hypothetical protein
MPIDRSGSGNLATLQMPQVGQVPSRSSPMWLDMLVAQLDILQQGTDESALQV